MRGGATHSRYPPRHQQPQPSKTNYFKLLALVGFSVGLLGGYLFLGSPRHVSTQHLPA